MSVADGDAAYDAKFDENEEKEAWVLEAFDVWSSNGLLTDWWCRLQRYKEARSQEMFPDEVDTPNDVEARVRFEKFE